MAIRSQGNSYTTGEHPSEGTVLLKRGRGRPKGSATVKPKPSPEQVKAGLKPAIEIEALLRDDGAFTPEEGDKPRRHVQITPPKFEEAKIHLVGTTPLVLHKFSQKVRDSIRETQEAGSQAKKGKTRVARDFQANYKNAMHTARAGWHGIPASAFRNAMISACRTVGFKMTIAKLSLFAKADGFDKDGTGLVRITKGEPHMDIRPGRNANGGIDLRARPMWEEGWTATLHVRWDSDQFSASDVYNLLARAGQQVGVGEGRPDSKMSAGCGWGEFLVIPS